MNEAVATTKEPPLIGWRLLALFYDLWPAVAIWMATAALFTVLHDNQPLAAFSLGQISLWLVCWLLSGAYAVLSWRRGGQTLGMRPWRLRVTDRDGAPAPVRALSLRYLVGTASLLLAGAGFWWAWADRERLTWHDRYSGTRLRRLPRRGA
jgi:uncharacterized RDD family membrane protein YckC